MKIIESDVSILKQEPGVSGLYKHMETVGRVSHRSEGKPGEDPRLFLERIKNFGHWAVFDLGTVYFKFPGDYGGIDHSDKLYELLHDNKWTEDVYYRGYHHLTTTFRNILKLGIVDIMEKLWCDPVPGVHKVRITSRWICSRAIANELVRHRAFSFIQESTRFINYGREKFGSELTYIVPEWIEQFRTPDLNHLSKPDLWDVLKFKVPVVSVRNKNWKSAEDEYIWETQDKHLLPGDARGCLPGDLKTEVYMCGYLEDYYMTPPEDSPEKLGFFYLRDAPDAHPDIRILAHKLKELMDNENKGRE